MGNTPNRAPKGGAISPINKEWYCGGQYMCTQPMMPKGYASKARRAIKRVFAVNANVSEIRIANGVVVFAYVGRDITKTVFEGQPSECEQFVIDYLDEHSKRRDADGLMPHPTKVVHQ